MKAPVLPVPQSVDKVCFHAKTAVARQRAFKSVCCANACARRPLSSYKYLMRATGGVYLGFHTLRGRKFPYGNFRTSVFCEVKTQIVGKTIVFRQSQAPVSPVPSFYYSAFFVSSSSSFASMPNSFASASRLDVLGSDAPVSHS